MDKLTALSVVANTTDVSRRCAELADELDPMIVASERRTLSPAETRTVLLGQRELLTRVSQQQTFLAEMVFHAEAPSCLWWRAFLWRPFAYLRLVWRGRDRRKNL